MDGIANAKPVHLSFTDHPALSVSRRGLGVGRPEKDSRRTSCLFPAEKEIDNVTTRKHSGRTNSSKELLKPETLVPGLHFESKQLHLPLSVVDPAHTPST